MKLKKDIGTFEVEFEDGVETLDSGEFHQVLVDAYTRTDGLPEVEQYRETVKTVQDFIEPKWGWKPSSLLVEIIERQFWVYWESVKSFFGKGSEPQSNSEP